MENVEASQEYDSRDNLQEFISKARRNRRSEKKDILDDEPDAQECKIQRHVEDRQEEGEKVSGEL